MRVIVVQDYPHCFRVFFFQKLKPHAIFAMRKGNQGPNLLKASPKTPGAKMELKYKL